MQKNSRVVNHEPSPVVASVNHVASIVIHEPKKSFSVAVKKAVRDQSHKS